MDRLTEMTCFVRAVETGSLAMAGRALGPLDHQKHECLLYNYCLPAYSNCAVSAAGT